jgi:serine/threonine protein kinase
MGEVYRARDLKLDRPVVLKFPHASAFDSKIVRERLIREAKASSALNHPNIVTIYEINEWHGRLFICMEYVEGRTLGEICRGGAVPIHEVIAIATQIVQTISAVHKRGVLHRDIKSSNIMLTDEGLVKVLDFGIAKLAGATALTGSQVFIGTPAYSAPEVIRGASPNERSEIYAVGVVLYELLAGRIPFSGEEPSAVIYAIMNVLPLSFQEVGRPVPQNLEDTVMKALAKMPEERYQTLEEMLHDLARWQHPRDSAATATQTIVKRNTEILAVKKTSASPGHKSPPPATAVNAGPVDLALLQARMGAPKRRPGENPYLNRVMIRHPDDFYGRKNEVQRIYSRIASAARPQSISVVGERRIGKSSLLHYLYHPQTRQKHLSNPQSCVFAFLDFQEEPLGSLEELFNGIYDAIRQEYLGKFQTALSPDYQGFRSLVRSLDTQGIRLIILFDEFERVTSNPLFDPEFFAFFRSMANKYNVAYVATTAKELQSLCHSKEIATSPFFNIFSNLNLGAFKPEEAQELICEPSAQAGYPLAPFAAEILNLAGLFPFYLQMACAVFFELVKKDGQRDVAMLREAKRQFLEEAGVHFKNTWEKFSPMEQKLINKLIAGKRPAETENYLANKLLKESYLIETEGGRFKLFSPAFADYLSEHLGISKGWKMFRFWK